MKRLLNRFTIIILLLFVCNSTFADIIMKRLFDNGKTIEIKLSEGELKITPLCDNGVRIKYEKIINDKLPELIYNGDTSSFTKYKVKETSKEILIKLKDLSLRINKDNGYISYYNSKNERILSEISRELQPTTIGNKKAYSSKLEIDSPDDEYLYGTGQFQDGYLNIKGLSRRLTQVNTQISVPFILSSRGYGLLWNNYGLTEFNPGDNKVELKKDNVSGKKEFVDITTTEGTKKEQREEGAFSSEISIPEDGRYTFLLDVGKKMARRHQLSIDDKEIVDVKNIWLPPTTSVVLELKAGKHLVSADLEKNDSPVLYYKKVEDNTILRSPISECLDYTIFTGNADEIISSFRRLSGNAPMMPSWALGYIHCRERFHSQDEIIKTTEQFRNDNIPMDLIVQDWQYWGKYGWNAMKFDETYYPDPKYLVDKLHSMDARLMLSVWSRIDKNNDLGRKFDNYGYFIKNTTWVDFFNPQAASYYWKNFSESLLQPYHIDAWWQDATEPENDDLSGRLVMNNSIPGELVRNVYPLFVNKTVYEGSRKDYPSHRTMILTRSGFSGIQKYGAAMWSGDVGNDWETLKRQITGGLNLMAAGLPWWTYDAGGFFRPSNQYKDKSYHERFLRWLQVSTFLPLMRVHGYQTDTEFWNYGEQVEDLSKKAIDLRYSLLPYIYSQNADISFHGGTLMRPLVMDFMSDATALSQKYQFMFGKNLLVCPILSDNINSVDVYLPQNKSGWFDYYNGKKADKNNGYVNIPVTLDRIPVFVQAGSIVPHINDCNNTKDLNSKPLEIRIYCGNNAEFTLYEDEGTNYNYEKGDYSTIKFEWNDSKDELTICSRKGSFDGMNSIRKMILKKFSSNNNESMIAKSIDYDGRKIKVQF